MTPLDRVLHQLENVCQSGRQYSARCPGHDDGHNSLSIGIGRDGCVLLHCFAGCSAADLIDAISLRWTDLFPERDRRWRSGHRHQGGAR